MQISTNKISERLNCLTETDITSVSKVQTLKSLLDFSASIETSTLARFKLQKEKPELKQQSEADPPFHLHAIVGCDIGQLRQAITPHKGDDLFILAPSTSILKILPTIGEITSAIVNPPF